MLITEHGCLPKKLNSYSHYAFQNQASQRLIYIIIYDVCMPAAVLVQASNHISFCLFQLICSFVCSAVMAMDMAQMTDQLKGEFKAVLNDVNMTPNGKMQKLMDMLKAQNISYSANRGGLGRIGPGQANRGGLGLDGFNVHKCGANILRVGANMNKLDAERQRPKANESCWCCQCVVGEGSHLDPAPQG